MKNPYHLLLLANVLADLLVGLSHLMATLYALNDINVVLAPQRERIFSLAFGTNGPGNKTLTH
jgi:hypothetical protein